RHPRGGDGPPDGQALGRGPGGAARAVRAAGAGGDGDAREGGAGMITIDQFRALDLRVGTVRAAEPHPNADRLLLLRMALGTSVDLAVDAGEVVVLLGPNGAGKTTLLRMLALLLAPTGGRLLLFGTDATRAPAALRRRIGYAGHEISCYPDLSGAENLAFYAGLFGVSEAAARIARLLTWAGLDGAGRRPVRTYSRGMGPRLALPRALL